MGQNNDRLGEDISTGNLYRMVCRMISELTSFRDLLLLIMQCDMNKSI